MTKLALAAAAALMLASASVPAFAADLMISPEPMAEMASGFNWQGPYVGGSLVGYMNAAEWGVAGEVGYNFLPTDNLLLGISLTGGLYFTGYSPDIYLKGRAGFVADRLAVYGFGAIGNYSGGPGVAGLGAGVEFAAMDHLSLFGEAGMYAPFGGPTDVRLETGVRFHF